MEFFSVGFWQTVVGLTIPAVIAILGYIFAYRLNMRFERRKKRNDLRIQFLIDAYRKIESSANRDKMSQQQKDDFESAISDIFLFGSDTELQVLRDTIFNKQSSERYILLGRIDDLLKVLRNGLRLELNLSVDNEKYRSLRF